MLLTYVLVNYPFFFRFLKSDQTKSLAVLSLLITCMYTGVLLFIAMYTERVKSNLHSSGKDFV